jgi:hypothetical protein
MLICIVQENKDLSTNKISGSYINWLICSPSSEVVAAAMLLFSMVES